MQVGRRLEGSLYHRWGGVSGLWYRLALKVIGMGDRNAVDLCQSVHEVMLRNGVTLKEGNVMRYDRSLPSSNVWQGLYY